MIKFDKDNKIRLKFFKANICLYVQTFRRKLLESMIKRYLSTDARFLIYAHTWRLRFSAVLYFRDVILISVIV